MVASHPDFGSTESICAALILNIYKEIHIRESLEMGNPNCHFILGSVLHLTTEVGR